MFEEQQTPNVLISSRGLLFLRGNDSSSKAAAAQAVSAQAQRGHSTLNAPSVRKALETSMTISALHSSHHFELHVTLTYKTYFATYQLLATHNRTWKAIQGPNSTQLLDIPIIQVLETVMTNQKLCVQCLPPTSDFTVFWCHHILTPFWFSRLYWRMRSSLQSRLPVASRPGCSRSQSTRAGRLDGTTSLRKGSPPLKTQRSAIFLSHHNF